MNATSLALAWWLARRELRAGIAGFRVFLACLAVGVAAIAAVGSVNEALVTALRADARLLLGGDVDVRLTHRPATAEENAWLAANSARLTWFSFLPRAISFVIHWERMTSG